MEGAFTIFSMPSPYPAVAYVEGMAGRLYVEAPKSTKFLRAYDRLTAAALAERESAQRITALLEELT